MRTSISNTQAPAPRSGCQMAVSLSQDAVYVHGGYSKVCDRVLEGGRIDKLIENKY